MGWREELEDIKASARDWRERELERRSLAWEQMLTTTYWVLREIQKDIDEYREEMSLGGKPYDPNKQGE